MNDCKSEFGAFEREETDTGRDSGDTRTQTEVRRAKEKGDTVTRAFWPWTAC